MASTRPQFTLQVAARLGMKATPGSLSWWPSALMPPPATGLVYPPFRYRNEADTSTWLGTLTRPAGLRLAAVASVLLATPAPAKAFSRAPIPFCRSASAASDPVENIAAMTAAAVGAARTAKLREVHDESLRKHIGSQSSVQRRSEQ